MFKKIKYYFFIFVNFSLISSCTLPIRLYQHVSEPITVPELKKENTTTFIIGSPGELAIGHHVQDDLYIESYTQFRGITTKEYMGNNRQEIYGLGVHKIMSQDQDNVDISIGAGIDYGKTEGGDQSFLSTSYIYSSQVIKHKLSYKQIYLQGSILFRNTQDMKFGLAFKSARSVVYFREGLYYTYSSKNTTDISNQTKKISHNTFALILRHNPKYFILIDNLNFELNIRIPQSINYFQSLDSLTLRIIYDF